MKRIALAFAALLLAVTGLALVAGPASAHTANFGADCNGVVLHAESYDGAQANQWTVTIAGKTQSGTFGATYDHTFAVPQDGTHPGASPARTRNRRASQPADDRP